MVKNSGVTPFGVLLLCLKFNLDCSEPVKTEDCLSLHLLELVGGTGPTVRKVLRELAAVIVVTTTNYGGQTDTREREIPQGFASQQNFLCTVQYRVH